MAGDMTSPAGVDEVPGPCVLCGDTNYQPSMGGPTICPSCDCGQGRDPRKFRELREANTALSARIAELERDRAELEDLAHMEGAMGDAGAKLLAEWIGYVWDGIRDDRIGDKGYPQWWAGSFQGGKQDLRDVAESLAAEAVRAERERLLDKLRTPGKVLRDLFDGLPDEPYPFEEFMARIAAALEADHDHDKSDA